MNKRDFWTERYAERELVWSAGPNRLLEAEVASLSPGRALDVACGEGRNALWLAAQGWQVTAVDFSRVAVEKAQKIGRRRNLEVDWVVLDVAQDALPARSFDLVCVLYLHTGAAERNRWLPAVIEAVAPGGTFLYIGHDPSNIESGVGGPQNPDLLADCDTLTKALDGFSVESAEVVERTVDADPGHARNLSGIALDAFVRAIREPASP